MFKDAFTKLEKKDVARVLDTVNAYVDGSPYKPETTTVLSYGLPFYPGRELLNIADYEIVPAKHRHIIYGGDEPVFLDGTNEPVYALNKEIPVQLDEDTVLSYVSFFFDYVRGEHGAFKIISEVDDISWREDPPPTTRRAVGGEITPLRLTGTSDNLFRLRATILFKSSLFKSDITVDAKTGKVTLDNQTLSIENMPIYDSVLEG